VFKQEFLVRALFLWQIPAMADHGNPENMVRASVYFALQQCGYQPPKTHDATARDAYYGNVAGKVVEHIKLSGWLIEPPQTLQKKPPVK
jgi:hypothetical protein